MKPNETEDALPGGPIFKVGPWRVPRAQFSVLVGSLAGASLFLILLLSLGVYLCLQKKSADKVGYSVKSELSSSSCTSGRSADSGPSLGRDSLVILSHGGHHQACLLPDGSPSTSLMYECHCRSCLDDQIGIDLPSSYAAGDGISVGSSALDVQIDLDSVSEEMELKMSAEENQGGSDTQSGRRVSGDHLFSSQIGREQISAKVAGTQTLPRSEFNDGVIFPDDLMFRSFICQAMSDETFKTRSLPIRGRSKDHPIMSRFMNGTNDLKWSKKRRNRMKSDAAAIIAIMRSRAQQSLQSTEPINSTATVTPSPSAFPEKGETDMLAPTLLSPFYIRLAHSRCVLHDASRQPTPNLLNLNTDVLHLSDYETSYKKLEKKAALFSNDNYRQKTYGAVKLPV